jgi:hypothetical protein
VASLALLAQPQGGIGGGAGRAQRESQVVAAPPLLLQLHLASSLVWNFPAFQSSRPRSTVTDAFGKLNSSTLFPISVLITGGPSRSAWPFAPSGSARGWLAERRQRRPSPRKRWRAAVNRFATRENWCSSGMPSKWRYQKPPTIAAAQLFRVDYIVLIRTKCNQCLAPLQPFVRRPPIC